MDAHSDRLYRVANFYYWVVLLLSMAGLLSRSFRPLYGVDGGIRKPWIAGYWLTVAAITLLSLVYLPFFGAPRFHFVIFPLLALFGAELLYDLYRAARGRLGGPIV